MTRYFRFFMGLALAVCTAAAYADPPGRVGRVNHASGAVSFAPAEAPDQWVQAPLNRPLTAGDRLWVDANSRAELHVGSTALRMGAQTNVDVLNLDDDTIQLRLAQGDLTLRVRDLPPGDRIEIATPSGAVLIQQPGSYRVNVDPRSDSARALVNFGHAQVVTPTQVLNVPSSQSLWFANGAPPQYEVLTAASADALDRWAAERDRREDRIAATRYVSPHMTGYEDLDEHGTWRTYPEYGAVWVPTRVASGWAPYRHGHWAWISPWGWTWVDDAPWGFAPFHYGRWVHLHGHWAWAPGTRVARPVYAPALVAFIGGSNFSVAVSRGPAVGWFPLGWREPYRPWYKASPTYVRNVNVTHVTNVTNITNVNYVNQANPQAVTVVPQQSFASARPVAQSALQVQQRTLTRAQVVEAAPARPMRASFAQQERRGQQPPATAISREVVAVTPPAKPVVQASLAPTTTSGTHASASGSVSATPQQSRAEHEPRVRVIGRERAEARAAERAADKGASQSAPQSAPVPTATAPAAPAPAAATPPAASASASAAPNAAPPTAAKSAVPPAPTTNAPAAAAAPAAKAATPPTASARVEDDDERRSRRERRQAAAPEPLAGPPERVARPPERQDRERPQNRREASAEVAPPPAARVEAPRPQAAPAAEPPRLHVTRPEAPRPQTAPPEPPRAEVRRPEPPRAHVAPVEPPRAHPPAQPLHRAEPPRPQAPQSAARVEAPRPQPPQSPPRVEAPRPPAQPPQAQVKPAAEQPRERARGPQQERHRDRPQS